jgi:hypothetical protein
MAETPKGTRVPDAVVMERVEELCGMLTAAPYSEIVAYCRDKWQMPKRTVDDYIARCKEQLAERFKHRVEAEAEIAKERLERWMSKAERKEDITAAIAAQRELTKLMGLAAPEKVEHDISQRAAESLVARIRDGQTVVIE